MVQQRYFVDATASEERDAPFGGIVSELEERGFVVLGRVAPTQAPRTGLAFDRVERARLREWAARPAATLLRSADRTAYAGVDRFGDAPLLRLRTQLTDGAVVETVSVASHGVLRPRSGDPFLGLSLGDAEGRSLLLLRDVTTAEAVGTHVARVAATTAERDTRPVEHDDRAAAVLLWDDLARHAVACGRALSRRVRLMVAAFGVAAYALVILAYQGFGGLVADPWWRVVLAITLTLVLIAALLPAMRWASRKIAERRGWRPPYPGVS